MNSIYCEGCIDCRSMKTYRQPFETAQLSWSPLFVELHLTYLRACRNIRHNEIFRRRHKIIVKIFLRGASSVGRFPYSLSVSLCRIFRYALRYVMVINSWSGFWNMIVGGGVPYSIALEALTFQSIEKSCICKRGWPAVLLLCPAATRVSTGT